jgi:LysR family transcriptional regulator, hydrogen peroxide-inducible genes activator
MDLPTLKQLRYFIALSEQRHFGKAAEQCFISQSAFSTAIRELQATLGTQLVNRTTRTVNITPAGETFANGAREVLSKLEALQRNISGPKEPLSGNLRLGVIPTIAPFLLPQILPKLRRTYPELELFLTEAQTAVLHQKLLNGEIDLILLALPFDLPATAAIELFRDRFMLAYRENTTKVDAENYNFRELQAGSVMLMEDGHCLRDHALDACELRGSEQISRFSANSLLSLVEMVDADLAVTYLPEMASRSTLLRHTKVKLQPLSSGNYRTIGLAWYKGSARAAEFELLGQFISKFARR